MPTSQEIQLSCCKPAGHQPLLGLHPESSSREAGTESGSPGCCRLLPQAARALEQAGARVCGLMGLEGGAAALLLLRVSPSWGAGAVTRPCCAQRALERFLVSSSVGTTLLLLGKTDLVCGWWWGLPRPTSLKPTPASHAGSWLPQASIIPVWGQLSLPCLDEQRSDRAAAGFGSGKLIRTPCT